MIDVETFPSIVSFVRIVVLAIIASVSFRSVCVAVGTDTVRIPSVDVVGGNVPVNVVDGKVETSFVVINDAKYASKSG